MDFCVRVDVMMFLVFKKNQMKLLYRFSMEVNGKISGTTENYVNSVRMLVKESVFRVDF